MGNYTELVLNVTIKGGTPPDVIDLLRAMANREVDLTDLPTPDHPFFKTDRWPMLMSCSSHYFIPFSLSKMESPDYVSDHYLSTRSDLKNYDNEIDLFAEWVAPYVDAVGKTFAGYKRYEEDDTPTLLYFENGKPIWVTVHE